MSTVRLFIKCIFTEMYLKYKATCYLKPRKLSAGKSKSILEYSLIYTAAFTFTEYHTAHEDAMKNLGGVLW